MSLKDLIAFSTRIPIKNSDIKGAAKSGYLFPIIAIFIGLIYGILSILFLKLTNIEIAAILIILSIYSLTGLIHLDGLADLSDALVASVNKEKKLKILKDEKIGIGGIFAIIITFWILFISLKTLMTNPHHLITISFLNIPYILVEAILLAEISAKLSIITLLNFGEETHRGLGSLFIDKISNKKYIASTILSFIISYIIGNSTFIFISTGIFIGLTLNLYGKKSFGGINGDFIGASNEISRALTLLLLSTVVI